MSIGLSVREAKEWYNMPVNLNDEIKCGEGYELEFKLVSYVDCMKCLT